MSEPAKPLLTDPTIAAMIDIAERETATELSHRLMRFSIPETGASSKKATLILTLRQASTSDLPNVRAGLLRYTASLLERARNEAEVAELRESLLADGYEVHEVEGHRHRFELRATDAATVPLGSAISALEAMLDTLGDGVAVNHYQQAVANFGQHNFESSNGQLRAAFEDVVVKIAIARGYASNGQKGQGGQAIRYLLDEQFLTESDGGAFIKGLWSMIHTNGPHPGLSNSDEARFRMQTVTAALRFLLLGNPP